MKLEVKSVILFASQITKLNKGMIIIRLMYDGTQVYLNDRIYMTSEETTRVMIKACWKKWQDTVSSVAELDNLEVEKVLTIVDDLKESGLPLYNDDLYSHLTNVINALESKAIQFCKLTGEKIEDLLD